MIRRLAERSGLVFALVFLWKLALLVFTSQPVPANDSFFYDGVVVNFLNGGGYCNPSLALAFPISGSEVFCAYPPLYQAVLLGWMSMFGTSALAAMWLHLGLFGLYLLVLSGIFRRLKVPALWTNAGGLFLFVITFQDRPDSLAHLLGLGAIYAWVRGDGFLAGETGAVGGDMATARLSGGVWDWRAAVLAVLTLATSLQIGAVYLLWLWLLAVAASWCRRKPFPLLPMAAAVFVPAMLIAMVKFGFPRCWDGFMEHALQTPTVAGWRFPRADELLKAIRTAPGVIAAGVFLLWLVWRKRGDLRSAVTGLGPALAVSGTIVIATVVLGALFFLSANFVLVTSYPQPLIVGCFLAAVTGGATTDTGKRVLTGIFVGLALLGAVRAIGMSTWGVACAADMSHHQARQLVSKSLYHTAPGSTVVLSSAFLYEAARHRELRVIHSDWLGPPRQQRSLVEFIVERRPAVLILTQFDFYRHYEEPVRQLQARGELVTLGIADAARLPPPDASRRLRRVVQHISWAPVIVELTWH